MHPGLEALFRERHLQFEQHEKGHILYYPSEMYKVVYPIQLSLDGQGFLRGEIWVPRQRCGEIADLEDFLKLLEEFLPPEVQVFFERRRQRFYVFSLMDPAEFDEEMSRFVRGADGAVPACTHAGELLEWEDDLLWLSFSEPEGKT